MGRGWGWGASCSAPGPFDTMTNTMTNALTTTASGPLTAPFAAPPQDADALADALVAGQLSPRTRRAYAADLAELLSALETWHLILPDVTRDHLHAYRAWLAGETVPGLAPRRPCAPATVSRKLSVVRRFFAEAADRGLIPRDPAARLRGFRVSGDSKTLGLTRPQASALLGVIPADTPLGLRDRALFSLMLRTGLRRMDVLGATLAMLGTQQGHRTLSFHSKGAKQRVVKIPPDVAAHLDAWLASARPLRAETPQTPVFCALVKTGRKAQARYVPRDRGQKHLSEKSLWYILAARLKQAGITDHLTPHSTRHTFITLALDAGAPLHKVQVAAGHADPRTTERYWRTQQNLDDNAVDYVKL